MVRLAVVAAALIPILRVAAASTADNDAIMNFGNVVYDISGIGKYFKGEVSTDAGGMGTLKSTVLLAPPGSNLNGNVPSVCASKVSDAATVMALQYVDTQGVHSCDILGKSTSIKAQSRKEVESGVDK